MKNENPFIKSAVDGPYFDPLSPVPPDVSLPDEIGDAAAQASYDDLVNKGIDPLTPVPPDVYLPDETHQALSTASPDQLFNVSGTKNPNYKFDWGNLPWGTMGIGAAGTGTIGGLLGGRKGALLGALLGALGGYGWDRYNMGQYFQPQVA